MNNTAGLVAQLLGRDSHSQKMKAVWDIRHCHNKLASILQIGDVGSNFGWHSHEMQTDLGRSCSALTDSVTL